MPNIHRVRGRRRRADICVKDSEAPEEWPIDESDGLYMVEDGEIGSEQGRWRSYWGC